MRQHRRVLAAAAVVALSALVVACGGSDGESGTSTGTSSAGSAGQTSIDPAFAAEATNAINRVRAQGRSCGASTFAAAPVVKWSDPLGQAALGHSNWMRDTGQFSHTGENGSDVGGRASAAGYTWRTIGENIAGGHASIDAAIDAWVASPTHCANLMNPAFEDIGLARANGTSSTAFASYWTLVLGAR